MGILFVKYNSFDIFFNYWLAVGHGLLSLLQAMYQGETLVTESLQTMLASHLQRSARLSPKCWG